MRHLAKRIVGLESKGRTPKLHVVRCYGDETSDNALDQYGRETIGSDDLVVIIRKPAGTAPTNGGEYAAA